MHPSSVARPAPASSLAGCGVAWPVDCVVPPTHTVPAGPSRAAITVGLWWWTAVAAIAAVPMLWRRPNLDRVEALNAEIRKFFGTDEAAREQP